MKKEASIGFLCYETLSVMQINPRAVSRVVLGRIPVPFATWVPSDWGDMSVQAWTVHAHLIDGCAELTLKSAIIYERAGIRLGTKFDKGWIFEYKEPVLESVRRPGWLVNPLEEWKRTEDPTDALCSVSGLSRSSCIRILEDLPSLFEIAVMMES